MRRLSRYERMFRERRGHATPATAPIASHVRKSGEPELTDAELERLTAPGGSGGGDHLG
jgi:hypothetical protein